VLVEKEPTLGATPSHASVVRFMKVQGLIKRPRRGPLHSPEAQATEHRIERESVCQCSVASGFSSRFAARFTRQRPVGLPTAAGVGWAQYCGQAQVLVIES
jgi:hypothetical protein